MTLGVTQICDQYAWLYTEQAIPAGTWDSLLPVDGAYAAVKRCEGVDYVHFRGSVTFTDWIEDFDDCALPFEDDELGAVHPGARLGVLAIKPTLDALLGPKVVLAGHSLGAMHAAIYAGYRVAAGAPLDGLVMWGEPRAGGAKLSSLLAHVDVRSYRNADADGHDLVTDVPRALAPLLPYSHIREPLIDVSCPPRRGDPWLAFRYHHFGLYCKAFGAAGPAARALAL